MKGMTAANRTRSEQTARTVRARVFLQRHCGVAFGRVGRSGRAFGRCSRRNLRVSSRASRTDSETLRLQALDGMPAHALDALAEVCGVLERTMRGTLVENGFRFGRTNALDAAQRIFISRIDVDRRVRVAESGQHG